MSLPKSRLEVVRSMRIALGDAAADGVREGINMLETDFVGGLRMLNALCARHYRANGFEPSDPKAQLPPAEPEVA